MPESEGQFVLDILSLYRMVELYKDKNPNDTDIVNHVMSTFMGFDGIHETKYMGFVRFLLDTQDKFPEQKKYKSKIGSFNSYTPTVDQYKRMVNRWHALGHKYN